MKVIKKAIRIFAAGFATLIGIVAVLGPGYVLVATKTHDSNLTLAVIILVGFGMTAVGIAQVKEELQRQ